MGIRGELLSINRGKLKYLDSVNKLYGKVVEYYSKIDFDELDRNDVDFRFLFDYSDGLIELGKELNKIGIDTLDCTSALLCCDYLNSMNYRRDVLSKYGLVLPSFD